MANIYDRQQRIPNWDQSRLTASRVAVIGDDALANFLCAGGAGLGINMEIYGNGRVNKKASLDEFLLFDAHHGDLKAEQIAEKVNIINPYITTEAIPWAFTDLNMCEILAPRGDQPYVIVNTSNNPHDQYLIASYGRMNNIPVINCAANETTGYITLSIPEHDPKTGQALPTVYRDTIIPEFYDMARKETQKQGHAPSGTIAGIALGLIRRIVMPIPTDDGEYPDPDTRIIYNLASKTRFDSANELEVALTGIDKKILQVGAGSTGTFTALNIGLKSRGKKPHLTIIDKDTVEEINMNRQILFPFYKLITGETPIGKKKADVLKTVIERINPDASISTIDAWFDRDFDGSYDILFDCVDSMKARREEHFWSLKHTKPVVTMGTGIQRGTSISMGQAYTALPHSTRCLDCALNVIDEAAAEEEREAQSCVAEPNPSVINPNMVVAWIAANEAMASSNDDTSDDVNGIFRYNSSTKVIAGIDLLDDESVCNHYTVEETNDTGDTGKKTAAAAKGTE